MRKFVEFLAWMQIVISPLIVAVIGGGIFYLYFQGLTRIIGWILIGLVGLILGIVFANRVTRKTSATEFISRALMLRRNLIITIKIPTDVFLQATEV